MRSLAPAILALVAVLTVPAAVAQVAASPPAAQGLLVFLDCDPHNTPNCDFDHFRREIAWVNWVRDREDADVHLLVTAQETGGGGWHYTLDYLGRRALAGSQKSLPYVSDPTDTDAEVREGLTRTIALGLVQYVETSTLAPQLEIVYRAPEVPALGRHEQDPWDLWVFDLSTEGSIESQEQESNYTLEGSLTVSRVSEDLKLGFDLDLEYQHSTLEYVEDSTTVTVTNTPEDYMAEALAVWSLGQHWSAGGTASANRSTFLNLDLAFTAGPAIEYDIFPYRESTRRSLTFRYALEVASFNYELETVEGKTAEVLPRHSLVIAAVVQQPWGTIDGVVEGVQYLSDPASHRINTFLSFEYRLFRGFNLDLFAQFSRIKDQFYIPAGDPSEEDVLLRRRQRETDYLFDIGIGFSYRFGSKFANVVNTRFDTPDFH
jgi:hypothetical protein